MKMSKWINVPNDLSSYYGFVYKITIKTNNKKYIGRCNFWKIVKRPPLKGKKNRRYIKKETDWRNYYGSGGKEWQKIIKQVGKDNIKREILILCKTPWEVKYKEAELQFREKVLLKEEYYNGIIQLKLPKAPKNLRIKDGR